MGTEIRHKTKIVIFDMDGVLVDSEPLHAFTEYRILREHGVTEMPDASLTVGKSSYIIWCSLIQAYHLPGTPDSLLQLQYEYLLEEMAKRKTKPSAGLEELFGYLKGQGIRIGLASSSNRFLVDGILDYLGIGSWFDYTTAGDEIPEKKPDPAVYLSVLKKSGFHPGEALAVEDSSTGLLSAYRAGIPAVGYRNPTSGNQDLSRSIGIVDALPDIVAYL